MKHIVNEENVSRETLEYVDGLFSAKIAIYEAYAEEILKWNKKINLVSRDTQKEDLISHIRHSLTIMYGNLWKSSDSNVLDAGSGGGLPGIPLAIAADRSVLMIDTAEKKMFVLSQIIRSLKLSNVQAKHANIADVSPAESDMYVSKHAFKLADFFRLTSGQDYSGAIFLKGDGFEEELEACEIPLDVSYIPLEKYHKEPFYEGKYVISIKRLP